MQKKFEYKVDSGGKEDAEGRMIWDEQEKALNEAGKEGWELVSVITMPGIKRARFYFKREISQ